MSSAHFTGLSALMWMRRSRGRRRSSTSTAPGTEVGAKLRTKDLGLVRMLTPLLASKSRVLTKRLKATPAAADGSSRLDQDTLAPAGSLLDRTLGLHRTTHFKYIGASSVHETRLLDLATLPGGYRVGTRRR